MKLLRSASWRDGDPRYYKYMICAEKHWHAGITVGGTYVQFTGDRPPEWKGLSREEATPVLLNVLRQYGGEVATEPFPVDKLPSPDALNGILGAITEACEQRFGPGRLIRPATGFDYVWETREV